MNLRSKRCLAVAAFAAVVAAGTLPAAALDVTVNGQTVVLQPPPIERAGRVFVPLRGVFQRLGASVVYANGTINATGQNNASISLHIGSTQATVNGASQTLDVAPFIVGATTYVPLRFVSQALGAGVNYDATNQIVALTAPGAGGQGPVPPPPAGNVLRDLEPGRGTSVPARRPTISANFAVPVDPNSLHIAVDGLDVTTDATRSTSGFIYAPPSPLQSMRHQVVVTGTTQSGRPFHEQYSFMSGTAEARNFVSIQTPQDGQPVGSTFAIRGTTLPNSRVHVVAGSGVNVGGFSFGTGTYVTDTTADGNGRFAVDVQLRSYGGGSIGVTVTSTNPADEGSAEKKLRLQGQ